MRVAVFDIYAYLVGNVFIIFIKLKSLNGSFIVILNMNQFDFNYIDLCC